MSVIRFLLTILVIIYVKECYTSTVIENSNITTHHTNKEKTCAGYQFRCINGECIPLNWKCNGVKDCNDGSDEHNCTASANTPQECIRDTQFDCGGNVCISLLKVCDGESDCLNGNDESLALCKTNECLRNNGGCSQKCTYKSSGIVCSCEEGYRLTNKTMCIDINECNDPSTCSQICQNTEGSHKCSCVEGYEIDTENPKHCKANIRSAELIFTKTTDIRKVPLNHHSMSEIVNGTTLAVALDFDYSAGLIYWNDMKEKKFYKAPINKKYPKVQILSNLNIVASGIAFDWIYKNLYWTDSENATIGVAEIEGNKQSILIDDEVERPRAIALSPMEGLMFWTDWGDIAKIERAGMDGKKRKVIVYDHISKPHGIVIDFIKRRIYWIDELYNEISSCDYNGVNRKTILSSMYVLKHPFSITLFENLLYWSDWQKGTIYKVEKLTGRNPKMVHTNLGSNAISIHVYHPYRQPNETNYCKERSDHCTAAELCLPTSQTTLSDPKIGCVCPENDEFKTENKTFCRGTCRLEQFECKDHKCIPRNWRCDGEKDCSDGEDEIDCAKCTRDQFDCGSGKCISLAFLCDGDTDCDDGSDEFGCPNGVCQRRTQVKCLNSKICIGVEMECDGKPDCPGGTDEEGCPGYDESDLRECEPSEFQCNDKTCINKEYLCDGDIDCLGSEDEDDKHCHAIKCKNDQFQCHNKACIPIELRCSGTLECTDGSDEKYCPINTEKKCDFETDFDCGDGVCISMSKVCDNHPDCANLEDEPTTCNYNECTYQNGGCSQVCVDTSTGYYCDCHNGFKLRDKTICEDFNECSIFGTCSQICINTMGGYACKCLAEYSVDRHNSNSCKAESGDPYIIFSRKLDIRKIRLHHFEISSIVENAHSAVAFDYNFKTDTIFWYDDHEKKLYRSPIGLKMTNEQEKTKISTDYYIRMDGLAVDWVYEHLYWTNSKNRTIEVSDFNGDHHSILLEDDLEEPRAIVLHPLAGWMFWSDWGVDSKIERAGMDGTQRKTIIGDSIMWPNGLTLDYITKRVYWVDAKLKTISTCDYEGKNRLTILSSSEALSHPFSIAIFEDMMYWTEWYTGAIFKANKFNGNNITVIDSKLKHPMVVRIMHPYLQPSSTNHCKSSNCSHICLPAPRFGLQPPSVSCACPLGHSLSPDKYTCTAIAKSVYIEQSPGSVAGIVIAIITILILMGCIVALLFYKRETIRYHFKNNKFRNPEYHRTNEDHLSLDQEESPYEVHEH